MKQLMKADQALTEKELISCFLDGQDISTKSKETYRRALSQFFTWIAADQLIQSDQVKVTDQVLATTDAPTLDRDVILRYKNGLRERGLSACTINSYLSAVRRFFAYAESKQLCPNIAKDVKGAKTPKGFNKDTLAADQVKTLLLSIDRTSLEGLRNFALLNLLVRTGLRTIEIVRADVNDIRTEHGVSVLYIQGKGRDSKDERVVLTDATLTPIVAYLKARNAKGTQPLFTSLSNRSKGTRLTTRSVSRIVKDTLTGAGFISTRLTAHSLRHTAITFVLLAGGSIQQAQELGRHANIATTMIYAHNIDRIANAPEREIDKLLA